MQLSLKQLLIATENVIIVQMSSSKDLEKKIIF